VNKKLRLLVSVALLSWLAWRSDWQQLAALFRRLRLELWLAGVGLYAIMSYTVAQSTRELGLRMALGAGPRNLLRLVLSRGLRLTAGGVLSGSLAGLALTRFLGTLLYKVSPHDPLVFGSALAVTTMTAIAACLSPAWRAARTDPARVLRQ